MPSTMKAPIPHLFFKGDAAQAIAHYERALGASTLARMRWGEMPGGDCPPAQRELVMHARLQVGAGHLLVADALEGTPHPPGGNGTMMLEFEDPKEMGERFDALGKGGTVVMAIHDAFWGAKFGILADPFGVQWMFHCETKKS